MYKGHLCFIIPKKSSNYMYFEHCPIIIMGDLNVDYLKDNNQAKKKKKTITFHE